MPLACHKDGNNEESNPSTPATSAHKPALEHLPPFGALCEKDPCPTAPPSHKNLD